jgi:hypothetical protein
VFEGDAAVYARDHVPKGKKDFLGARRSGQLGGARVRDFDLSGGAWLDEVGRSRRCSGDLGGLGRNGRTGGAEEVARLQHRGEGQDLAVGHGRLVSEKTSGRSGC